MSETKRLAFDVHREQEHKKGKPGKGRNPKFKPGQLVRLSPRYNSLYSYSADVKNSVGVVLAVNPYAKGGYHYIVNFPNLGKKNYTFAPSVLEEHEEGSVIIPPKNPNREHRVAIFADPVHLANAIEKMEHSMSVLRKGIYMQKFGAVVPQDNLKDVLAGLEDGYNILYNSIYSTIG